jgi:hypothetical protein
MENERSLPGIHSMIVLDETRFDELDSSTSTARDASSIYCKNAMDHHSVLVGQCGPQAWTDAGLDDKPKECSGTKEGNGHTWY